MATIVTAKDPRKLKLINEALTHHSLTTANLHYDLSRDAGDRRVWDKLWRDILRGKGPVWS